MTLAALGYGSSGVVERIDGDDDVSLRLMEMGVTPGTEIRLLGAAPLGDPLEIELLGYRLSVRRAEAARIQLRSL